MLIGAREGLLRFPVFAPCLLLLLACGTRAGETNGEAAPRSGAVCVEPTAEQCSLFRVPLRELLDQPTRWRGRRVAVEGYLHLQRTGSGLWPSKKDYEERNFGAALFARTFQRNVVGPTCKCNDQMVVVVAMYDPSDKGPQTAWGGTLNDIEQVQPRLE